MANEGCVFVWLHAGVCETEKRQMIGSDLVYLLFFISLFRLPEPRADPLDPRDFDDSDSGPSMDHAP